jgi:tRNA (adenine37-N6)-methyltransferase
MITMNPIGVVRTEARTVPRHWSLSELVGQLIIKKEYVEGLADIQPGQKIVVLFCFDRSPSFEPRLLKQTPPHREKPMGVFSICSPKRPNPIGLSVLEVLDIKGGEIQVKGLDMLDNTPILDIKPHIETRHDCPSHAESDRSSGDDTD